MKLLELQNMIENRYDYLFEQDGFNIVYSYESVYPPDLRLGLNSTKYNLSIFFLHEYLTGLYVGQKGAKYDEIFAEPKDTNYNEITRWIYFENLISFIDKKHLKSQYSQEKGDYPDIIEKHIIHTSRIFKKNRKRIYEIFSNYGNINSLISKYYTYFIYETNRKFERRKTLKKI